MELKLLTLIKVLKLINNFVILKALGIKEDDKLRVFIFAQFMRVMQKFQSQLRLI